MHEIQRKLLALAQHEDIAHLSLRKVGDMVGVEYAAQVRHHLNHLVKHGYLVKNAAGALVVPAGSGNGGAGLLRVPFMGEADCGEATMFASGQVQGYLSISPRLTHYANARDLYALKARGDSMDQAKVNGKYSIQDSDYVLVQRCNIADLKDGDYVVSVIDGLANIKRYQVDNLHQRIVLTSQSHQNYPPIIIASEDLQLYEVAGKVVDVIKGTTHLD